MESVQPNFILDSAVQDDKLTQSRFISVLCDQNLKKPLDYAVPIHLQNKLCIGMRVEVPLRSKIVKATIIALKNQSSFPNVKEVISLLPIHKALSEPLWKLANWMSQYYCSPLSKILKCFIPPSIRKEVGEKKEFFFQLGQTQEKIIELIHECRTQNPLFASILDAILQTPIGVPFSELKQKFDITQSQIQTLIKKKWLKKIEKKSLDLSDEDFFQSTQKKLNDEQKLCLSKIENALEKEIYETHLIQGVTGSGKTEIYLQAIQKALDLKKSTILLVPEVALTSQTIERFRSRFKEKIAIWHHRRSLGQRNSAWEDLSTGKIQIVIGARSAIFCPVQNLGLIIVDEEHDSSYKQSEDMPCYHGRDVAVMRSHLEKAVVILGSATPSIESRYNAEIGKYTLSKLTLRATKATIPKISIIDMKRAFEINGGFTHFSSELIDALKLRLEKGEQSLLFLNKRGFHRLQICASCRSVVKCPHCDLGLTYHKSSHELKCHLCDYHQHVSPNCSHCGATESLEFKGFGTEHVERSLHALLPTIRTLRMDRDTTKQKNSHEDIYKQFRAHKADVLIGTQMIAKGFHFPSVTLVGILNMDATLHIPDFRSSESAFQLITQVAGRAGRSSLPGTVILQTFMPDHPILHLASSQDFDPFYSQELEERKLFNYPPFCHLIKLTFSGKEPLETQTTAQTVHTYLSTHLPPGSVLLPPIASGHAKIKDLYRFQLVIKTAKISPFYPLLSTLDPSIKVDIDPSNTFF